jgi:DNA-binding transcriptional ArsR family regulator
MARTPTTHDPFNAVAEPKRRQLLELLRGRELSVNEIVDLLGWPQPMVSKHLGVLKQVELVSERRVGRQRMYRVNAERLKPIFDWVSPFERYWSERFERLDDVLQELQEQEQQDVRKQEQDHYYGGTRQTGTLHHQGV